MRFAALFRVQLLEIRRNPIMGMMPTMIIVLTAVWALLADEGSRPFMISAALLMAPYMVGLQVPAQSLAEERDKRTLEALFLTPARPMEVIGSKLAATALIAVFAAGVSLAIFKTTPAHPAILGAGFGLAMLLNMSIGTAIGLLAPDQKSAGMLAAPFMMVQLFGTMMPWEEALPGFWAVSAYLPTRPMFELFQMGVAGVERPVLRNILVLLPYVLVPLAFAVRQIRRQASNR